MLHRRLIICLAAAVVTAALLAPSAVARPDYPVGPAPVAIESGLPAAETVRAPAPTPVVDARESSDLDWGSAGIGAGVAVAFLLVAGLAASTLVHHRRAAAR